jgi:hypothetical protein
MKKLISIAVLALGLAFTSLAGPGGQIPGGGTPSPAGSPLVCEYYSCDHYHGGYEINVVTKGNGYWQVFCVDHTTGVVSCIFTQHCATPFTTPWATWIPSSDVCEFYLVTYQVNGYRQITHL